VFAAIGLARFGYTMVLPFMEKALSLTKEQGGLLASANLLGYLILSLAAGFIAARFGSKKTILVALACVTLALAATALARDFTGALVARFLTGLASGGANVPAMTLLARWFSSRERGLASGIAVGGTSLGLAVSGLAVPLFASTTAPQGWPGAWLLFSAIAAGMFVFGFVFLKERPRTVPAGDAVPTGAGVQAATGAPRLLAAIPAMLKTRGFPLLAFAYFLYGFSYIIYATFFVNFLIRERHFDSGLAGGLWFMVGVASIASGLLWGALSDRIGRARSLAIIYGVLAASYCLFGLAKVPGLLYVSGFLFALCSWSVPAVMAATAGDILGSERASMGFGMLTFTFGLGQAAGPALAGVLASAVGSYAPGFLLAAGVSLAGGALLLFVRTGKKKSNNDGDDKNDGKKLMAAENKSISGKNDINT
jgi:MFS family permease